MNNHYRCIVTIISDFFFLFFFYSFVWYKQRERRRRSSSSRRSQTRLWCLFCKHCRHLNFNWESYRSYSICTSLSYSSLFLWVFTYTVRPTSFSSTHRICQLSSWASKISCVHCTCTSTSTCFFSHPFDLRLFCAIQPTANLLATTFAQPSLFPHTNNINKHWFIIDLIYFLTSSNNNYLSSAPNQIQI